MWIKVHTYNCEKKKLNTFVYLLLVLENLLITSLLAFTFTLDVYCLDLSDIMYSFDKYHLLL